MEAAPTAAPPRKKAIHAMACLMDFPRYCPSTLRAPPRRRQPPITGPIDHRASPAERLQPLQLHLTDLDRWLRVGVVRYVTQDGLGVRRKGLLIRLHRLEQHVEHHHVGGRRAGLSPAEAVIHERPLQRWPQLLLDHGDVPLEVV